METSDTENLLGDSLATPVPQAIEDFERIFAEASAEIYAFLDRRVCTKLRRRLDSGDLVQETHLAALKQLEMRPSLPPRIWLLRIAHQQLIQAYRRHFVSSKRTLNRETDWYDCSSAALAQGILSKGSSPSAHLQAEELRSKLQDAMSELNSTDREVLLMRHFENRPYAEIAVLLDLPADTVRQRFGRALLRLRSITKRLGLMDHLQ